MRKKLYIVAVIWAIVLYIVTMPAINIHSLGFWHYALLVILPFAFISFEYSKDIKAFFKNIKNRSFIIVTMVALAVILLADFVGTPYLGGLNNYRNRINIPESSDFSSIDEFYESQVQIIDKNISSSLAERVFGEMGADVVSQFEISDNYSSIVVNNTMYRITPIEYNGFIKWISTKGNGTPGFITVNVTSGETEFHELEEGLRYTEDAYLLDNISTHLRLQYPTFIFGNIKFEVDDDFNPYWVSQVMKYNFVGKSPDVKGVVVTDPISGESTYYSVDEVPEWVDNVYDARLVSSQYNAYGKYVNGLLNFSQKGMTAVTDDYAYLQKDGHLWMYTGITSVGNDESNVGFIYVDLQNKDVIYIVSAGAEEYSARASAEGAVQEKGYTSVFPTMVNIDGEPVYFMGLKDNAGLIKAYAFVSYKNYQKVGVGSTVNEALKNYTGKNVVNTSDANTIDIVVEDIASAVKDGYTIYYIKTSDNYYYCSIEISNQLPFVKAGDRLTIVEKDNEILEIQ